MEHTAANEEVGSGRNSSLSISSHALIGSTLRRVWVEVSWRRWVESHFKMTEGTKYWNMHTTTGCVFTEDLGLGKTKIQRGFESAKMIWRTRFFFPLRSNVRTDFQKHRFYKLSPFDIQEGLEGNAKHVVQGASSTVVAPASSGWGSYLLLNNPNSHQTTLTRNIIFISQTKKEKKKLYKTM